MALPLENVTILDLSRMLPGPYCTMVLSDLGANIIKIEAPKSPALYSNPGPYFQKGNIQVSVFNTILARNKKSMSLNLKDEKGIKIFYQLVKKADVVMETFRPGVLKRLKIDYDTLSKINPSIILCSLSGFGQEGPYEQIAGHDLNYIGISGLLHSSQPRKIFGKENQNRKPFNPSVQTADIGGGLYCVIGILGALYGRDINSEISGQHIDISMTDISFSFSPWNVMNHFTRVFNNIDDTDSNDILGGDDPFYSVYKTKDGKFMAVGAIEPKFRMNVCQGIGRDDLKEKLFPTSLQPEERETIFKIIETEFSKKTRDEWWEIFKNIDACVTPVNTYAEACEDPQILKRKMVETIEHPTLGKINNLGSPIKLSKTPLKIRSIAPILGEHTEEILKLSLGYTDEQIQNLKDKQVI